MTDRPGGGISHLEIETIDHDGVVVMVVSGDIDITNVNQARVAVEEQMNHHPEGIVVCLAVGFFASTGLSLLAETNQRARLAGIRFAVVAPGRTTRRALEATGLDQVLPLHETVPHAVEALRTSTTAEPTIL
ncbi:STAS domain-containing protein [Lentzea sp. DG1S-22]|uniref:STAS domain-containing protein n=1 Tax=Lentzea sp. DG1S-22 TaxID=3108822 RepID=UPI002E782DBC|nr:STAS domain-containing protein [Lentzea sp. DG1S-22]WVH82995.1 STAS domain-containing protein [Lentzea sp. DG1S-22]